MARLQKMKDAGYNVASIRGCEFRKLLLHILALKINFVRTPMLRIHLLIYAMPCTWVETKLKHTGKKSDMWMPSVYPYICKYGNFL